jgi:hypothetical protein
MDEGVSAPIRIDSWPYLSLLSLPVQYGMGWYGVDAVVRFHAGVAPSSPHQDSQAPRNKKQINKKQKNKNKNENALMRSATRVVVLGELDGAMRYYDREVMAH